MFYAPLGERERTRNKTSLSWLKRLLLALQPQEELERDLTRSPPNSCDDENGHICLPAWLICWIKHLLKDLRGTNKNKRYGIRPNRWRKECLVITLLAAGLLKLEDASEQ